jgi:hypothetical protein
MTPVDVGRIGPMHRVPHTHPDTAPTDAHVAVAPW